MATAATARASNRERLDQLFRQRIVIFDGSIGVLLQKQGLNEEDWRGERFRDHPKLLKNNVDILNLSRPDVVTRIHREYLEAGADLITTNTFTATPISQADYGLEDLTYEINFEGARLAREAVDKYENRFVAGSLGPTNVTLSLSPKVEDPSYRDITFDELRDGYAVAARLEQISSGALQVNMGTLYPGLLRMEQHGFIRAEWDRTENNRRARFYTITAAGRRRLDSEKAEWSRMASIMQDLLYGVAK